MGINVLYVGKKPFAVDNVAGSGKVWNGEGDVQEVTERQARTLIGYPDQWALAKDSDLKKVNKIPVIRFIGADNKRVEVPETELSLPLERMSADQLIAFSIHTYGQPLPLDMPRVEMVNVLEEKAKGTAPLRDPQAPALGGLELDAATGNATSNATGDAAGDSTGDATQSAPQAPDDTTSSPDLAG